MRPGNLQTESQPDDTTTTYSYDDESRLTGESVVASDTDEPVFSETYAIQPDGLRSDVIDTRYNTDGTVFSQTETDWTYDADGRLTNETLVVLAGADNAPAPFADTYAYDLEGDRVSKSDVSNDVTDTTTSTYNSDGELTKTVDTVNGTTTYTYDDAGNQLTSTTDGITTTNTYDLRGRLASVTSNGSTTSYTYDTAGNRTSETTGGTTTFYLNDPNNPTGYAKPVEAWTTTDGSRADATLAMSYMIGAQVVAQANGGSITYLLTDGQGSTRALMSSTGVVIAALNYDAFGDALSFDPASAGTIFLYGGDGMYDGASGLYFHGAGRQSDNANDRFIEMDGLGYGSNANPLSLNLYLLDGADAVNMGDPSGHDFGELAAAGIASTLDTLEFTGFSAVYNSVRGVENGLNGTQVLENFLIDQAFQAGAAVGLSFFGSVVGALQDGGLFSALTQEGEVGFSGPATDVERIIAETDQEDEILFGQRRAGDTFDPAGPNSLVAGKTIYQVANELKSGIIKATDLPIQVFRDPGTGNLVSMNTRSLAALSIADVNPVYEEISYSDVSERVLKRLTEDPLLPDLTLPGPYLPITPSRSDVTVLDIIARPGYPAM